MIDGPSLRGRLGAPPRGRLGAPPRGRLRRAVWRAGLRPRPRMRELALLGMVALTLLIGWVSLASTQAGALVLGEPGPLLAYLAALAAAHGAFVLSGRGMDQVLLPVVGLLGGISLLLMTRLPDELAARTAGDVRLGLAQLQLAWLLLAVLVLTSVAVLLRRWSWLRHYRYTWAMTGVALLVAVVASGREVNGVRLSIEVGPLSGQPSELLKLLLVVFLAAYLADNRALLAASSLRLGPLRLPPLPWLAPMLAVWGLAIAMVVVQRDLGTALLCFGVFLALLYVATGRAAYVLVGLALLVGGSAVLYRLFPHVQLRVNAWLDPWADPLDGGFQAVRALFAFGRGGILGTGLGAGLPQVGDTPAIPLLHTDLAFAALGEELGMVGAVAVGALYLIIGERGLRIAARAGDDFATLLAAGLALLIVLQAALIMAGNLKLVPLTGITLPFVSYGGSSLVASGIAVGMLLALSARRPARATSRVEVRA